LLTAEQHLGNVAHVSRKITPYHHVCDGRLLLQSWPSLADREKKRYVILFLHFLPSSRRLKNERVTFSEGVSFTPRIASVSQPNNPGVKFV
jgi:hypothetical protein